MLTCKRLFRTSNSVYQRVLSYSSGNKAIAHKNVFIQSHTTKSNITTQSYAILSQSRLFSSHNNLQQNEPAHNTSEIQRKSDQASGNPGLWTGMALPVGIGIACELGAGHVSSFLGFLTQSTVPVPGILLSIVAGITARALIAKVERNKPTEGRELREQRLTALLAGSKRVQDKLLPIGAGLIGFKLSITTALTLGASAFPFILATSLSVWKITHFIGKKLGLDFDTIRLTAIGSTICGGTAIAAAQQGRSYSSSAVVGSLANVFVFGFLGTLLYPGLSHSLASLLPNSSPEVLASEIGFILGATIHDTAQVVAAADAASQLYGNDTILQVATLAKMDRVMLLPFILAMTPSQQVMSIDHATSSTPRQTTSKAVTSWKELLKAWKVPLFIKYFVIASCIRYLLEAATDSETFQSFKKQELGKFLKGADVSSRIFIASALAAIGLNANRIGQIPRKTWLLGFAASSSAVMVASICVLAQHFAKHKLESVKE